MSEKTANGIRPPRNEHELELRLVRMLGNDNRQMLVMRSMMANTIAGTAPHIQVVGTDGIPAKYYYLNDGWYDNGTADGDYKAGRCDQAGNIVSLVIPAQSGFWVKATTGELTFTYKK